MCVCVSRTVSQTVLWSIDCKGYILTRSLPYPYPCSTEVFSRLLTFNLMWCKSAAVFNELCFFLSDLFFFFLVNAQLFWWTGLVVTSIEWMNEYVNSFMCALVVPWTINRCVKLLYFFFLTSLYEWWTSLFFPCNCGHIYDKEPFSHTKDRPPGVIQQVLGFLYGAYELLLEPSPVRMEFF